MHLVLYGGKEENMLISGKIFLTCAVIALVSITLIKFMDEHYQWDGSSMAKGAWLVVITLVSLFVGVISALINIWQP